MHAILSHFDAHCHGILRQRRRETGRDRGGGGGVKRLSKDDSNKNQADHNRVQLVIAPYHNHPTGPWCRVKTLLIIILSLNCFNDLCNDHKPSSAGDYDCQIKGKWLIQSTLQLTRGVMQVVVLVAAADSYADASAESPSIDALEDEDEDDEELDASASNEYPDGDNDNDESYEDSDDDRQESQISENWLPSAVLLAPQQRPVSDYSQLESRNMQVRFNA